MRISLAVAMFVAYVLGCVLAASAAGELDRSVLTGLTPIVSSQPAAAPMASFGP
jgi:hypothetical protein